MNQDEKLCRINIPTARKEILQSIAEYRMRAKIVAAIREFFTALDPTKKVTKTVADKLHAKLTEDGTLPVTHVWYKQETGAGAPTQWTFEVRVFGLSDTKFYLRCLPSQTDAPAEFDLDWMFLSHTQWNVHADFLEERVARFAYNAGKFNDLLDAMAGLCLFAQIDGQPYPVHPLSKHFHWYQLHDADVRYGE